MASLKETKKRIGSVKNTQKITRAMKLVSAAKYARANNLVLASRPYGNALDQMIADLAGAGEQTSPLLEVREEKRILLVVSATDRGLCGGLNANLLKFCQKFISERKKSGVEVELMLWGKRADFLSKNGNVKQSTETVLDKPSADFSSSVALQVSQRFEKGEVDAVYFGYSFFQNAMSQVPTCDRLLPVSRPAGSEAVNSDVIYEPSKERLMDSLLRKQLSSKIYRILLEGSASEHSARMTAMDSATNNAQDVIKGLTLEYNRARQAAITTELVEITAGAEAL